MPRGNTQSFDIWGRPSENRNFTPKVSVKFLPEDTKTSEKAIFFSKWHQISQEFLKIDFTVEVLTKNDQILKIFSINPKVSNSAKNFDPKIWVDASVCIVSE